MAKRRAKPIVSALGSSTVRAASTTSSGSLRRRHLPAHAAADEVEQPVLQGVVRFPQLARIDVVERLPDLGVAHPFLPVGAAGRGRRAGASGRRASVGMWTPLVMWPMGISSSTRHGHRWAHIRRETWPCSELTAFARRESFRPITVMQNGSCSFCGSTRPRPISCAGEMPSLSRSGPKCSSIRFGVEAIVAGGHGRVRGEDGVLGDFAERFVERQPVVGHPLADHFQRGERAVAFVQVIDAGHDAQRPQRLHAADAEHQLLANAGPHVAAVEPRGQLAVLRAVAVDVAIEQVQRHAADVHQPDLGQQPAVAGFDRDRDRLAVGADRRLHRQVLDARVEILFLLDSRCRRGAA